MGFQICKYSDRFLLDNEPHEKETSLTLENAKHNYSSERQVVL